MQIEKIIVYASRQLEPYEQNHPTHDLELAEIFLCKKIQRDHLNSSPCKILLITRCLKYIFTQKEMNLRQHSG